MNHAIRAGVLLFLLSTWASLGNADESGDGPTAKEKQLLATVSKRLLAACTPVPGYQWPPEIDINGKGLNADAAVVRKADGKLYPIIRIFPDTLRQVVRGDPDRLAYILGHELGHILNKHCDPTDGREVTPLVRSVFDRNQEFEADLTGARLMVQADFSFARGKRAILVLKGMVGQRYSSFEGLGKDHPSWDDRLARLDSDQAQVWRAMSAFQNGVTFLATEQYREAEICFDRVVKEFPHCHEAWVNLGFACLMQYCDKLATKDLRDYGIGQILVGGFYERAESIPVRGRDAKLWYKAEKALNEALRLNENLTLAKANLGLAYLIHPDGKQVDQAAKYLQEAATAAAKDTTLDPIAHAALLVNLGVVVAASNPDKGLRQMEEGEKIGRSLAPGRTEAPRENPALASALLYNRAVNLAARKDPAARARGRELLEQYLGTSSQLSLWWPLAYERYVALSKELAREPRPRDSFRKDRPEPLRLVTGLKLRSGKQVRLDEDVAEVVAKLGKGEPRTIATGAILKRLTYQNEGIDLIVANTVLAICLTGPGSPPLALRGQGIGADTVKELRVGMSRQQIEAILGNDSRSCEVTTPGVFYLYYRAQGVAVRLDKEKKTAIEIVVVQIPRE